MSNIHFIIHRYLNGSSIDAEFKQLSCVLFVILYAIAVNMLHQNRVA